MYYFFRNGAVRATRPQLGEVVELRADQFRQLLAFKGWAAAESDPQVTARAQADTTASAGPVQVIGSRRLSRRPRFHLHTIFSWLNRAELSHV
jgi:hypothetical protein